MSRIITFISLVFVLISFETISGKFVRHVSEKNMLLCHTGVRTTAGRQCNGYITGSTEEMEKSGKIILCAPRKLIIN